MAGRWGIGDHGGVPALDHVTLVARDVAVTTAFYDLVLGAVGAGRVVGWRDIEDLDEVGEEAVGYGTEQRLLLWVVAGPVPSCGAHLAVRVGTVDEVDAAAAVTGGVPRRREHNRPGYYGLMLTDPDGTTLEIFTAR